jgi:hypothetical protein
MNETDETIKYVTANGHEIKILAVPPFLLDKVMGQVRYPAVPTYEAVTASGEKEIHPHDETTLNTPEEKKLWAKYEADLEAAKLHENEMLMNAMFLKGIDVDMDSERFQDWVEEQKYLGIELAQSKPALKVQYISTEILANMSDLSAIMGLIMKQSGVAAEVVDQAIGSFQGAVAGATARNVESQAG